MAKNAARPGRTLIVFALVILAMYVGLAATNTWKPKLGLDLQGGTRITLTASTATGEAVTPAKLSEAAGIVDSRVNASGVAEAEVSTQGSSDIVVEIPGQNRKDLVDTVKQTAQLRFRLVAASAPGTPQATPQPSAVPSPSTSPSKKGTKAPKSPAPKASKSPAPKASQSAGPSASPKGRAVSEGLVRADKTKAKHPKTGASTSPTPSATPLPSLPAAPSQAPSTTVPTNKSTVPQMLAWAGNPDPASQAAFAKFQCTDVKNIVDNPAKPLITCDKKGFKYLLSPAIIEGTQLSNASYGIPQNDVQYVVNLDFNGDATNVFADVTRALVGTQKQFAIVLDGVVLSAPVVNSPITDGNAQISGSFTAGSAKSLANSLKYGALPLKFEVPVVTEEGPTLAGSQLSAGLWAGAIGLLIVMIYCLFYYRGLGIVVVASLLVAGAVTYAAVLFLSATAGFTLTLPGIAGLIVAVGITADSFIVYFERIRDEMREGRTVRVAVESGWNRAKMTCVAADAVSLLAAVVLYIFAIGVVKGFAFALGISTVIDLAVFFLFTHPLVTLLARRKFFASGHRFSGLSPSHVGIERIGVPRAAGGTAR
ncbi:MAG: preprotein translocase subunit SecD [Nocardioidaceae bacterium]|nr:preprotein translocase subunit SecD [Nocardioidaceae bacterium]